MIAMVHARKVSLLQEVRLEYGFRQYLKTYCYHCIEDVDTPYTVWMEYKEYTFCSKNCSSKERRMRYMRQRRTSHMDDLCRMYQE
jgi:hypothetical protein